MSFKEPLATTTTHGVVKIGDGISVNNGTISVSSLRTVDYAYFYSTSTQTNPVASAVNIIPFNNIGVSLGISLVAATQILVSKTANYNLSFSVQIDKTDSRSESLDVWVLKNGVNVPNTNTVLTLLKNGAAFIATWSFILRLNAGDFIQLAWQSTDLTMILFAKPVQTAPSRPETPSAGLTIIQL